MDARRGAVLCRRATSPDALLCEGRGSGPLLPPLPPAVPLPLPRRRRHRPRVVHTRGGWVSWPLAWGAPLAATPPLPPPPSHTARRGGGWLGGAPRRPHPAHSPSPHGPPPGPLHFLCRFRNCVDHRIALAGATKNRLAPLPRVGPPPRPPPQALAHLSLCVFVFVFEGPLPSPRPTHEPYTILTTCDPVCCC